MYRLFLACDSSRFLELNLRQDSGSDPEASMFSTPAYEGDRDKIIIQIKKGHTLTDALSNRKLFPPEARCSLSCSSVGSRCCRCPRPGPCCPGPLAVEPGRCPGTYRQDSWSKRRRHLSSHILIELARCNVEVLPHALLVVADVLQLLVKAVLNVVFDEVDALPPLPGGRDHSDEDKMIVLPHSQAL